MRHAAPCASRSRVCAASSRLAQRFDPPGERLLPRVLALEPPPRRRQRATRLPAPGARAGPRPPAAKAPTRRSGRVRRRSAAGRRAARARRSPRRVAGIFQGALEPLPAPRRAASSRSCSVSRRAWASRVELVPARPLEAGLIALFLPAPCLLADALEPLGKGSERLLAMAPLADHAFEPRSPRNRPAGADSSRRGSRLRLGTWADSKPPLRDSFVPAAAVPARLRARRCARLRRQRRGRLAPPQRPGLLPRQAQALQLTIAPGAFGLDGECLGLGGELGVQVGQPLEVGTRLLQPCLRLLAPFMVAGDASRLFEETAQLLGLCLDDTRDHPCSMMA